MPILELRQKIEQQLAQLPLDQLLRISTFIDSLETTTSRPLRRLPPLKRHRQGAHLLRFAGSWNGNDLAQCRQFVQDSRSQAEL
jgi:hypothetical protein